MGPARASAAIDLISVFFGTGQALGPLVAGIVADATGTLSAALVSAAAVAFLGALGTRAAVRAVRPLAK